MTEGCEQDDNIEKWGESNPEKEVLFVMWYTTNGGFDDGDTAMVNPDAKDPYGPFEIGWEPDKPGKHILYGWPETLGEGRALNRMRLTFCRRNRYSKKNKAQWPSRASAIVV